jgi:hypothetical protein
VKRKYIPPARGQKEIAENALGTALRSVLGAVWESRFQQVGKDIHDKKLESNNNGEKYRAGDVVIITFRKLAT